MATRIDRRFLATSDALITCDVSQYLFTDWLILLPSQYKSQNTKTDIQTTTNCSGKLSKLVR